MSNQMIKVQIQIIHRISFFRKESEMNYSVARTILIAFFTCFLPNKKIKLKFNLCN